MATLSGRYIPEDVCRKIIDGLDLDSLFCTGQVGLELRELAAHHEHWAMQANSWSPEFCGSLQTDPNGKDFRILYRRWNRGKPSAEALIKRGHLSPLGARYGFGSKVRAIKLSQPGPGALVAWSIGTDSKLIRSDVTTCETDKWVSVPAWYYGLRCLDVIEADGRVCTGGKELHCWDPQMAIAPVIKDYDELTGGLSSVITALKTEDSAAHPRLLTAGDSRHVFLWDLANLGQVVQTFAPLPHNHPNVFEYRDIQCLAIEPHNGTLIAGGRGGLTFWNLHTGDRWPLPDLNDPLKYLNANVKSIVVGTDSIIVGSDCGVVEWTLPDPQAARACVPKGILALPSAPLHVNPRAIQGLAEGPVGILGGTADGSIGTWKCLDNPALAEQQFRHLQSVHFQLHPAPAGFQPPPFVAPVDPHQLDEPVMWSLKPRPVYPHLPAWAVDPRSVSCLAAADEIVVSGFMDGKIRIARMKGRFEQVAEGIDYDNYG